MFGLPDLNLKLIAIAVGLAVTVGAIAYPAYKLGGSSVKEAAQADADKRVQLATETYQQLMVKQIQLTDHYRSLADTGYADLIEKITHIKVTSTTVTNNITKEVQSNPTFYNNALPDGGRQQWIDARNLFR